MLPRSADAVIIGGGAIGVCAAYYLVRAGLRPCLLERRTVSAEASGHNLHMIIIQTKVPGPVVELGRRSMRLHEEIQAALGDDFGTVRGGMMMVHETPESLATGRALVPAQRAAGLDMAVVEGKDLRELEPALAEDLAGAILCRNDFNLDPVRFTQGVGRGAVQAGATICEGTEVTGVRVEGGKIAGVGTATGEVATRTVICAAGAWSAALGPMVGLTIPITPRQGIAIRTVPVARFLRHGLLDGGYVAKVARTATQMQASEDPFVQEGIAFGLVQRADGSCVLGGCRRHVGFDRLADPLVLDLIRARVRRFVPRAVTIPEAEPFVNFRPYGEDHAPLIGPVEGLGGLYLATGHEGMGLTLGPATGELIADLITGRLPAVDPTNLLPTPDRLKPSSGHV